MLLKTIAFCSLQPEKSKSKGLSYLRLADIYFKDKADYISAKKYYDSTYELVANYPGYQGIKKKGDNLQLLADRYGIISQGRYVANAGQTGRKSQDGAY